MLHRGQFQATDDVSVMELGRGTQKAFYTRLAVDTTVPISFMPSLDALLWHTFILAAIQTK